jgi:diphosphomevalonate decarboxylase
VKARSQACANIALAKYWGKLDHGQKLTAVPSLSITLDGLVTTTTVDFSGSRDDDEVELDGVVATGRVRERVVALLERVRELARTPRRARVSSSNAFPTAAGLASSASGFAALVVACDAALELGLSTEQKSALARECSASAARSLYGGFVELLAGAESASRVAPAEHFPLHLLVAVTVRGPKKVGSSEAMDRTKRTSPYYSAWVEGAPSWFAEVKAGVQRRDLNTLGPAMEQSTLCMHASMMAAVPPVLYFEPATLLVLRRVEALREGGVPAYFTMDAGPHVKVLCEPQHSGTVRAALTEVPGVVEVLACTIGGEPRVELLHGGS